MYQWGSSCDWINGAATRLFRGSAAARELLEELVRTPMKPNGFNWGRVVYGSVFRRSQGKTFTVFPTCFFDLWWTGYGDALWDGSESALDGPFLHHIHQRIWREAPGPHSAYSVFVRKCEEVIARK